MILPLSGRAPPLAAPLKVLLMSDAQETLASLAGNLVKEGFQTEAEADPARGLKLAGEHIYELAIVDLPLGGLRGREFLPLLLAAHPGLPIVVLSTQSDVSTKVLSFQLGADDFVTKPYEIAELIVRARARANRAQHILRVRGISLDLVGRRVDTGSGAVALSPREFLLLYELVVHAGTPVTREALLRRVWGYTFNPGTNVVDVYISRLRAKLGALVIETVKGSGYRVVDRWEPAADITTL